MGRFLNNANLGIFVVGCSGYVAYVLRRTKIRAEAFAEESAARRAKCMALTAKAREDMAKLEEKIRKMRKIK